MTKGGANSTRLTEIIDESVLQSYFSNGSLHHSQFTPKSCKLRKRTFIHTYIPDGSGKLAGSEAVWWAELNTLPAMSMAKGRSDFQPVYQPTTLPLDTRGRSYGKPPANPTGQTETPRVLLI